MFTGGPDDLQFGDADGGLRIGIAGERFDDDLPAPTPSTSMS